MKYRNGFVTNSSSSSFIVSFKDENDYDEFKNQCSLFNYNQLFQFINNKKELQENKKISIDELKEIGKKDLLKYFGLEEDILNYEYNEKLNKLLNDKIVVKCECDTFNGGLLQFAIHHNLLEEEFYQWLVCILFED